MSCGQSILDEFETIFREEFRDAERNADENSAVVPIEVDNTSPIENADGADLSDAESAESDAERVIIHTPLSPASAGDDDVGDHPESEEDKRAITDLVGDDIDSWFSFPSHCEFNADCCQKYFYGDSTRFAPEVAQHS
jgi:hypothetical protein